LRGSTTLPVLLAPIMLSNSCGFQVNRQQPIKIMNSLPNKRLQWSNLSRTNFILLICGLSLVFSGVTFAQQSPHKIKVNDPALAKQIAAQGGKLLADYGSYQVYELSQVGPGLLANQHVELRDEYNVIQLNAAPLDTTKPEVKALRKPAGSFQGKRMHLIHFVGPVQPQWRDELEAAGVKIISYIPQNAYLVYGDSQGIAQVQKLAGAASHIQWEGAYQDDYKIHPAARNVDKQGNPRQIGTEMFSIQLVGDPEANGGTLQLLDQLKLEPFQYQDHVQHYINIVAHLSAIDLQKIAARPDVISIHPYFPPKMADERQDQIVADHLSGNAPTGPGYLSWLASRGFTQSEFTGSGLVVDVADSGLDNGTTRPNHFGLYTGGSLSVGSRVVYNHLEGTSSSSSVLKGCDGHGTINAHIIGGYDNSSGFPFADTSGYHYGLGVCPYVKLGSSVILDNAGNWLYPTLYNLVADAYDGGARISNNSWGAPGSDGAYDMDSQAYDFLVRDAELSYSSHPVNGNQEMIIVFSAGNEGLAGAQTVSSPSTAKNVISVGAADNVQPFGGADGGGIGDSEASSANEIASFSSRGPCTDGRHKPDLMAPGTHVSGGVAQALNPGPTGTADPCFDLGVDGGPNGLFFPDGQQFYTASSGTSHAAPCVVGGCALLWQFFLNFYSHAPSPAMTKAYLMNSARYLTGTTANDTLWSDSQGMGEMDLGLAFDGTPRILRDELALDLFTASGQTRTYTGVISDSSKPFRVTVAWTDAPGSTTGGAYNNDLDLTVTVNGNTYNGNVFSGAYSATGGSADLVDNVESVFLPAGTSGSFVVTVTAANINSDGVPGNSTALDQDYALVVYNAQATGGASIILGTPTLIGESYTPTNGIVDPDETVTFSIPLQNGGGLDTTNLVATLLATNGVFAPSGPQTYGVLTAGGAAVSRPFTFTAQAACGGTITAILQLQDGATNYGTVSFNIPVGKFITVTNFAENFDEVLAPNLPAGWASTATGDQSPWTVTETQRDGASGKSVYVGVPPDASIAELVSPAIHITSSFAQVTFRNNYWLLSGVDGGVLEIQIGNGAFQDILAAGGTFAAGGYTMTLNTTSSNPLGGRSAWSGVSSGFITTTVTLPAAVAGQNIRLRWRCGTGVIQSGGGVGWYLDNLSVTDGGSYSCASLVSIPSLLNPQVVGGNLTFSIQTAGGHTYTLEYKNSLTDSTWTPLQTFNGDGSMKTITTALSAAPQRFYRVGVQ
jgi:hypothetical protein